MKQLLVVAVLATTPTVWGMEREQLLQPSAPLFSPKWKIVQPCDASGRFTIAKDLPPDKDTAPPTFRYPAGFQKSPSPTAWTNDQEETDYYADALEGIQQTVDSLKQDVQKKVAGIHRHITRDAKRRDELERRLVLFKFCCFEISICRKPKPRT